MTLAYKISSKLHQTFLDNVRARRKELGWTQAEVAKRLGISQATYANIESGRNTPTLEMVEKIARALNVGAVQLLVPQLVAA